MSDENGPTFWDLYFSPPTIQGDGAALPLRSTVNFVGGEVSDDEANKRTEVRLSRIVGDASDGIAHVDATRVHYQGDDYVDAWTRFGHISTDDDTPTNATGLAALLDLNTQPPQRLRLDVTVTAINEDGSKGGVWKIPAHVGRDDANVVTLYSGGTDPAPDAGNTADLDAEVTVDGFLVRLTVTGLAAERFTWGWEFEYQRQLFEEAP